MPANTPSKKTAVFNGLRTVDLPEEVGMKGLVVAENVDITRKNRIKRRKGQLLANTAVTDSAYIDQNFGLATAGNVLSVINEDLSLTEIRNDLTPSGQIIHHRFGKKVFYSNGFETGVYENGLDRSLGLDRPEYAPIMTDTAGDLDGGRFIAACAFVRDDGQESGLSPIGYFETQAGGVVFNDIPMSSDPTVSHVRIYLTHPNGEQLYRAAQVMNGDTMAEFRGHQTFLTVPATTQYLDKPPPFHDIDLFNSRMVYACDDYLFYSEPHAHELVSTRFNWVDLGGKPLVVGVVPSGLFVATESETWYLGGSDLKEASLRKVADYGAVPRTRRYINANLLAGDLGDTPLPMWVGATGFVVGTASGELLNISEKNLELPLGVTGTAMFRHEDGQNHYVAVIHS